MSVIYQRVKQGFDYLFYDLGDPRVKDWWFMSNPLPLVTVLALYLYFCSFVGPKFMKHRKPYQLKNLLMLYNIFQIALSVFMTYRGIEYVYYTNYRFNCQIIKFDNDPENLRWASTVWWYFFAKISELLDTVFFVLRKKDNQVSFLHIYHHSIMPIVAWIGTKYAGGGQAIPEGSLNSFIHVLMYGYYFLAGLGPQYQKYLWWKKHLTSMQLVQFCIIIYLNITGMFSKNCNYPKFLNLLVLFNCFAFLHLFGKFYYNSYITAKKIKRVEKEC